ncbi:reverse transcriptase domain-containing protein [Buttiauxella brennerae]|uniref:reverse transcriptase domain-containing protein n=1 Tax=Buttiauxella brennerae TaxID=82988 RepID=UPI00286EE095|nr:reverse transcriptase domain-containing protein [Buttiauxella brennerae]
MAIEIHRWKHKFEIRPAVWVYVPTKESKKFGSQILNAVRFKWTPALYFYHLRTGGHLAAARLHLNNEFFAVIDIKQFFQSTSRSRITRELKTYFTYPQAREIAKYSTVKNPLNEHHKHVLPFGFVQSPILATLCLDKSYVGKLLRDLNKKSAIRLSVYMDDVIISSNDLPLLERSFQDILKALEKSDYRVNTQKSQPPSPQITVFNLVIQKGSLKVMPQRMSDFLIDVYASNYEPHKLGIANYVKSVNQKQATLFKI